MSDTPEDYAVWDEFLRVWPLSRLPTMTLDEYSQAGSKDSFTYWLEARLDKMGSIWGGMSFKFGIYSRKATEPAEDNNTRRYNETHAWYTFLGETPDAAFERVRNAVVQIANWATKGDLAAIESFADLGDVVKWKIAFHYQNRLSPSIVNVFKQAMLVAYLKNTALKKMSDLQGEVMKHRPSNLGVLEFGKQVLEVGRSNSLSIWKLSHGNSSFTPVEQQDLLDNSLAVMHEDTGKSQAKNFIKAPVGTLFFLCHGNSPQLLGAFTSEVSPSKKGEGWLERSYKPMKSALKTDRYTANTKGWSPQGNSTFWRVDTRDLVEFERTLLKPYFDINTQELVDLAEPIPIVSKSPPPKPLVPTQNRIFYGPPGTGKTYRIQQLLETFTDRQATQTRDEFARQLVAELSWWQVIAAALFSLGRSKVSAIESHELLQAKIRLSQSTSIRATLWGQLQMHAHPDDALVKLTRRQEPFIFRKAAESQWEVIESTLREECSEVIETVQKLKVWKPVQEIKKRYEFITFHQSYSYEEFVEGIRPVVESSDEQDGQIRYAVLPGIFRRLCARAEAEPDRPYALFIDEINRGNLSKIFGELITLIELDKRLGAPQEVRLKLPYSGDDFAVPANLSIFGTMNTADRSLAFIDAALRRRFQFEEISTDYSQIPDIEGYPVREILEAINERIEHLFDRDHAIGHAGLMKCRDLDEVRDYLLGQVMPLLQEYFHDSWDKIAFVLNDSKSSSYRLLRERKLRFVSRDLDDDRRVLEIAPAFRQAQGSALRPYFDAIRGG